MAPASFARTASAFGLSWMMAVAGIVQAQPAKRVPPPPPPAPAAAAAPATAEQPAAAAPTIAAPPPAAAAPASAATPSSAAAQPPGIVLSNPAPPVAFRCDDGTTFAARFTVSGTGSQVAELRFATNLVVLSEEPIASGIHYTDGRIALRGTGSEFALERAGRSPTRCVEERAARDLRYFEERTAWVRFDYPPSWEAGRFAVLSLAGADAAARQRGAIAWISFDYLPLVSGVRREPLVQIIVFPAAAWKKLAAESGRLPFEMLSETESRVFVGTHAKKNPYAPGSQDATRFGAMMLNLVQVAASFSVVGSEAVPQTKIAGTVSYKQRIALPRDALVIVQVEDSTRADVPAIVLGESRIDVDGRQVPIPFEVPVESAALDPQARITLSARILRGDRLLFINDTPVPLPLSGSKEKLEIVVVPVGAPRPN